MSITPHHVPFVDPVTQKIHNIPHFIHKTPQDVVTNTTPFKKTKKATKQPQKKQLGLLESAQIYSQTPFIYACPLNPLRTGFEQLNPINLTPITEKNTKEGPTPLIGECEKAVSEKIHNPPKFFREDEVEKESKINKKKTYLKILSLLTDLQKTLNNLESFSETGTVFDISNENGFLELAEKCKISEKHCREKLNKL